MKRLQWVLVLCGLSCGAGANDGANDDEPVDMTPEGVCAFYADRDCSSYDRCAHVSVSYLYNDIATCRERAAANCKLRLTAPGTSETPDRIVACAKDIAKLSCEAYADFDRWPASCASARGPSRTARGALRTDNAKDFGAVTPPRRAASAGPCRHSAERVPPLTIV
jgi:hypothetical protein